MKDFNGIEFASEHNGTDVFRLIELAYEQGQKDAVKQLPSALGTNLAEVGTDCISRQQAIKTVGWYSCHSGDELLFADNALRQLPPAQPEIIRCRECKFASGDSRICMKFDHSPIGELDFCSFAERREVNHESN